MFGETNLSEDAIVYGATTLCIIVGADILKLTDSLVCKGIVPEFKVSIFS